MISVGIIGASGYTGAELLRLLSGHPELELAVATGFSDAGKTVGELYPSLFPFAETRLLPLEEAHEKLSSCALVFLALPHGESMKVASSLSGPKLVDLSSDFRLKSAKDYELWYGRCHTHPNDLSQWVYGLPELNRSAIKDGNKIANPGCFATASILGLAPLIAEYGKSVEGACAISAVSGLSGAGKSLSGKLHFSHAHDDVVAYKHGTHQHVGEIEQCLSILSGQSIQVSLTTHLVPMTRGIHATSLIRLSPCPDEKKIRQIYLDFYANEPFVGVPALSPSTKTVRGSNMTLVYPTVDKRNGMIIVTSVIDNLVKGASGAALQNANCMLGLPESQGLLACGLYP